MWFSGCRWDICINFQAYPWWCCSINIVSWRGIWKVSLPKWQIPDICLAGILLELIATLNMQCFFTCTSTVYINKIRFIANDKSCFSHHNNLIRLNPVSNSPIKQISSTNNLYFIVKWSMLFYCVNAPIMLVKKIEVYKTLKARRCLVWFLFNISYPCLFRTLPVF